MHYRRSKEEYVDSHDPRYHEEPTPQVVHVQQSLALSDHIKLKELVVHAILRFDEDLVMYEKIYGVFAHVSRSVMVITAYVGLMAMYKHQTDALFKDRLVFIEIIVDSIISIIIQVLTILLSDVSEK